MRISDWSSDVCSSDLDLAQVQRADRLFDLVEITDHHPGQCARIQRARGGVDLFRGQVADLRVAQFDPVVRAVVADDAGDGAEHRTGGLVGAGLARSEEHTSELQSLMRISYAVFCLKKK